MWTHNLFALFKAIPDVEEAEIARRYLLKSVPEIRPSINECLEYYSKSFENWRYTYENINLNGSITELRTAFRAIAGSL